MSQIQNDTSSKQAASFADATTKTVEHQINELKETIAKLAAEGHIVKDATKQLDSMIEKIRILKFRQKH
jgi:hypothetical protein